MRMITCINKKDNILISSLHKLYLENPFNRVMCSFIWKSMKISTQLNALSSGRAFLSQWLIMIIPFYFSTITSTNFSSFLVHCYRHHFSSNRFNNIICHRSMQGLLHFLLLLFLESLPIWRSLQSNRIKFTSLAVNNKLASLFLVIITIIRPTSLLCPAKCLVQTLAHCTTQRLIGTESQHNYRLRKALQKTSSTSIQEERNWTHSPTIWRLIIIIRQGLLSSEGHAVCKR